MCFEVHLTQTKLLIFLGEEVLCFWKSEKAPDSVRRYAVVNTKNKFKGADNLSVWYPAVIVEIEEVGACHLKRPKAVYFLICPNCVLCSFVFVFCVFLS